MEARELTRISKNKMAILDVLFPILREEARKGKTHLDVVLDRQLYVHMRNLGKIRETLYTHLINAFLENPDNEFAKHLKKLGYNVNIYETEETMDRETRIPVGRNFLGFKKYKTVIERVPYNYRKTLRIGWGES
jgi:hypothetical protein